MKDSSWISKKLNGGAALAVHYGAYVNVYKYNDERLTPVDPKFLAEVESLKTTERIT